MGHLMIVYGYIKPDKRQTEHNLVILEKFPFDENWPLPNIFHFAQAGVHPPIISFALPYYSSDPDWVEWMPSFEKLLGHLYAEEAVVHWDSEIRNDAPTFHYYCQESPRQSELKQPGDVQWLKIEECDIDGEGQRREETLLL